MTEKLDEELMRAYKLAFGSPAGQAVLADLSTFCRGAETCAVPGNHDLTFILLGRNEVWLRIQRVLSLTPAQIMAIRADRAVRVINKGEDNDVD